MLMTHLTMESSNKVSPKFGKANDHIDIMLFMDGNQTVKVMISRLKAFCFSDINPPLREPERANPHES